MRKILLTVFVAVAAALSGATTGCAAPPPPPPHHPAYLQALSELRVARWMLEHRPGDYVQSVDEAEAVRQIDGAINDLKQAAFDDGKNINDHPPVEEIPDHRGRLHNALDHLHRAQNMISREEDNGYASGLRGRALGHIDAAERATAHAIGS